MCPDVLWRVLLTRLFFFFNDTATTEIYTLSLHDALPISTPARSPPPAWSPGPWRLSRRTSSDRKSTRLNSSHRSISYAVFCLKKEGQPMTIIDDTPPLVPRPQTQPRPLRD